jgi:uncharacterized OB-fold protein
MDSYKKPLPRIDTLTRPFWEHAQNGRLAIQYCDDCGDGHFPASPICPKCNSDRQSWRAVSGRGTLQSWVAFHRAYWPAFVNELPYDVCLVRLNEGPVMVSTLVGGTAGAKLGAPVEVLFEPVTEEVTLPKWKITPAT